MSTKQLIKTTTNNNYGTIPTSYKSLDEQIQDQDVTLDAVHDIASNMKILATDLHTKITNQHEIILDLTNSADHATNDMKNAENRIKVIEAENGCCGCKCIALMIGICFIVLVIVGVIIYAYVRKSTQTV